MDNIRNARHIGLPAPARHLESAGDTGRDRKVKTQITTQRFGILKLPPPAIAPGEPRNYPLSRLIQCYWLPTIRTALQLNQGNTEGAIALLEASSAYVCRYRNQL